MPEDTRETDPRRLESLRLRELDQRLRQLKAILPHTRGSIEAWAQHMVNLTDAVQALLEWVTQPLDPPQ